jgi:hypothetical protein
VSYARPGKLFTANSDLFEGQVGLLREGARHAIVTQVVDLLRRGDIPSAEE